MQIKEAIDNIRELKDEALRLRPGMDYKKSLDIASFCDSFLSKLYDESAYYGEWQEVASMPSALKISDVDTQEKRDAVVAGHSKSYVERVFDDDGRSPHSENDYESVAALNSSDIRDCENVILSIVHDNEALSCVRDFMAITDGEIPFHCFSPYELVSLRTLAESKADNLAVCETLAAAAYKDAVQLARISGMKNGVPVEELMNDFCSFHKESFIYDYPPYLCWLMKEMEPLISMLPPNDFIVRYYANDKGKGKELSCCYHELQDMDLHDVGSFYNPYASVCTYYVKSVCRAWSDEYEHLKKYQDLFDGKFDSSVEPVIQRLQNMGADTKKIENIFSGIKKSAFKILAKIDQKSRS